MLKGKLVALREKRLDDAPRDHAWRCDPELARYDAVRPLRITLDEFLPHYQFEMEHPSPWQRRFAIEDGAGKHIGNCMYYNIDWERRQVELGILIGERDYWSRGYGSDAVLTMLEHIFSTTTIERVYLHTLEWNHRAQAAFAKCGFVAYRRVWRDGQEFIAMELWRHDWLATHAAAAPPGSSPR